MIDKEFTNEEITSFLEAQVNQAKYDLKENLLPNLGHSQKERLLIAISEYPTKDTDFSDDSDYMIKAFSALKACFDANVVLGVEMVHQELGQQTYEQLKEQQENKEVNNG